MAVNPNSLANLVTFKKGFDPRRNLKGQPKSLTTITGEHGYSKSDMVTAINMLITLDQASLEEIADNESSTALEKIVSSALLESIRKKSLWNIETLLNRIYGQPKQEVDQNITVTAFNITLNLNGDIPPQPSE